MDEVNKKERRENSNKKVLKAWKQMSHSRPKKADSLAGRGEKQLDLCCGNATSSDTRVRVVLKTGRPAESLFKRPRCENNLSVL